MQTEGRVRAAVSKQLVCLPLAVPGAGSPVSPYRLVTCSLVGAGGRAGMGQGQASLLPTPAEQLNCLCCAYVNGPPRIWCAFYTIVLSRCFIIYLDTIKSLFQNPSHPELTQFHHGVLK